MITDQDIQKIVERIEERFFPVFGLFATKDDIREIRADISKLRERTDGILTVLDTHTKMLDDLHIEYYSMGEQVSRHDRWIHMLAKKTDTVLSIEA